MTITTFVHRLFLLTVLVVAPVAWAEPGIPSPPQLAAKSYGLMDAASGKVLVENAGDERLPPASLTKLMTAYIATLEIKKGQISESDMVTVSEKAWRTGGSRMFIQVNTRVSVDDLLHGIIIQSGNDASVAMAEHIALALRAAGGRIEGREGAAALLDIHPNTLRARMQKLGLDWHTFRNNGRPGYVQAVHEG